MSSSRTRVVCLKTTHLRTKENADNVKEWVADPNNLYVGRAQRIFIHTGIVHQKGETLPLGAYLDKRNRVVERFTLSSSPWQNRFKIDRSKPAKDEHSRVVEAYRKDILQRMANNETLKSDLMKLRGKSLGCWCTPPLECHATVLAELVNALREE